MTRVPVCSRLFAALALATFGSAALAAVGARVLVQEWNPTEPDKVSVRVLVDDPDVVSRSVAQAWGAARVQICAALKARLGTPKIAKGQSLYDIDCQLDPNAAFTVQSAGANALRVSFAIRGNSVAATSTVPDPLGKPFDPRFSLTLDASFAVTLAVQADRNNTLRATDARFALAAARIDSHNASADVIKFVVDDLIPFFGGPNFKQIAESAINGVSVNLASTFNSALGPVNARLRGPSDYVRVGVWGRASRITVAFGPREIPPPGGGTISGVVRWDPAHYSGASCTSFALQASVQTGPAPLQSPDDYSVLGPAPWRKVGSLSMTPNGDRECRYVITGMPAGWPSAIVPTLQGASQTKTGASTMVIKHLNLRPEGWSGPVAANANGKNYLISLITKQFNPHAMPDLSRIRDNPLAVDLARDADRADLKTRSAQSLRSGPQSLDRDTLQSPHVARGNAATPNSPSLSSNAKQNPSIAQGSRGAAVSLNPQPLPPKESPFATPAQGATGAAVSRDPQPLPPKASAFAAPINADRATGTAPAASSALKSRTPEAVAAPATSLSR